jgi:hypothetical protein
MSALFLEMMMGACDATQRPALIFEARDNIATVSKKYHFEKE